MRLHNDAEVMNKIRELINAHDALKDENNNL